MCPGRMARSRGPKQQRRMKQRTLRIKGSPWPATCPSSSPRLQVLQPHQVCLATKGKAAQLLQPLPAPNHCTRHSPASQLQQHHLLPRNPHGRHKLRIAAHSPPPLPLANPQPHCHPCWACPNHYHRHHKYHHHHQQAQQLALTLCLPCRAPPQHEPCACPNKAHLPGTSPWSTALMGRQETWHSWGASSSCTRRRRRERRERKRRLTRSCPLTRTASPAWGRRYLDGKMMMKTLRKKGASRRGWSGKTTQAQFQLKQSPNQMDQKCGARPP